MPVDEQTTEALDKIFNAWLAANKIISHNGKLYQSDDQGQILYDAKNNPITVIPEQFKLLIVDPIKGIDAYATQQGIHIHPVIRDYPK